METYTPGTKNKRAAQADTTEKGRSPLKWLSQPGIAHLLILVAYLCVEFFPFQMEVIDNVGVHWLYLSAVNVVAAGFLTVRREFSLAPMRNVLGISYLAFCGWCAVSVFSAFNKVEWLVTFSRVLITAGMFVNCAAILNTYRQSFRRFIWLLVASGALQAILVIISLFSGHAVDVITLGLGNKNILAASLIIKFAVVIFAISSAKGRGRWLVASAMALLTVAIYALSSRSAIAGMLISVVLYVVAALVSRKWAFAPLAIVVSIFAAVSILMQVWSAGSKNAYLSQSIKQRISSVKEEVAGSKQYSRAVFWQYATAYISDHPLSGGGLGNWKINAMPYEKKLLANNYHSMHVHNDLLELGADTGVPGVILYLSIFIIYGWIAVRILVKGQGGEDVLLFLASFAGMVAYLCDASFNFPLERANMQMLFGVLLALGGTSYNHFFSGRSDGDKPRASLAPAQVAILLVAVSTLFISWKSFRSMQGQFIIREDMLAAGGASHSYEEIEPYFGTIPNITQSAIPVADIKAKYLLDESRYDEALQIIAADGNSNPYMPFRHMILGTVYRKKNDLDSAYRHFSRARELAPLVYTYYAEVQKICAIRKDSVALKRNFAQISSQPQEAQAWIDMAQWTMSINDRNIDGASAYFEEAQKRFPGNRDVPFHLHSMRASDHINRADFKSAIDEGHKALQLRETYEVVQNLGLAYFGNHQYDKALQYFDMSITKFGQRNGEAVYFRGQCYYIANDVRHACADFQTARNLKYPVEAGLLELCK